MADAIVEAVLPGVVALGLVVAAAKAHGRQLRLEREQAGYPRADFRGPNDAWVETFWRHDRIRFWWLFATTAPWTALWAVWHAWPSIPLAVARAALHVAWVFAGCFWVVGVWSLWRLADREAEGWRSHAIGTSFLWWTLVSLLFGLSAGLAR
ncbi:MAG TPA: hypothetical protein VM286_02205 [Candidatus Thermoplasmatota archaeon]|nr:hypothetical protein [Candidatus Thermoplasmatota archaeon]